MGEKRRFNEWIDEYNTGTGRRWCKKYTVRLDRIEGKEQIQEQLDDMRYGIDPDGWEYG